MSDAQSEGSVWGPPLPTMTVTDPSHAAPPAPEELLELEPAPLLELCALALWLEDAIALELAIAPELAVALAERDEDAEAPAPPTPLAACSRTLPPHADAHGESRTHVKHARARWDPTRHR
jgi:hypothetical protein